MSKTPKVESTQEAWETGKLGRDEAYVAVCDDSEIQNEIDEALELQMISIRMQKGLLEDLKMIADIHGMGYQPMMKQILKRFVDAEKRKLLKEAAQEAKSGKKRPPIDTDLPAVSYG